MGWDDRKIKGPKAREGKPQNLGVGHSKKRGWKSPENQEKSLKNRKKTPNWEVKPQFVWEFRGGGAGGELGTS